MSHSFKVFHRPTFLCLQLYLVIPLYFSQMELLILKKSPDFAYFYLYFPVRTSWGFRPEHSQYSRARSQDWIGWSEVINYDKERVKSREWKELSRSEVRNGWCWSQYALRWRVAEYRKRKTKHMIYLEGFGGKEGWFQKLLVSRSELQIKSESIIHEHHVWERQ